MSSSAPCSALNSSSVVANVSSSPGGQPVQCPVDPSLFLIELIAQPVAVRGDSLELDPLLAHAAIPPLKAEPNTAIDDAQITSLIRHSLVAQSDVPRVRARFA
jgi:hypothetical protein